MDQIMNVTKKISLSLSHSLPLCAAAQWIECVKGVDRQCNTLGGVYLSSIQSSIYLFSMVKSFALGMDGCWIFDSFPKTMKHSHNECLSHRFLSAVHHTYKQRRK